MKNQSDEEFIPCEDCPNPSMCVTYCRAQESVKENISKVHNEIPRDFWEDH